MSRDSRMKKEINAVQADLFSAIDRDLERRPRQVLRPVALAGIGVLALSGPALAAGSAAGVIHLPGGATATETTGEEIPRVDEPNAFTEMLVCPGRPGGTTLAYVAGDSEAKLEGCRKPTAAERAELANLSTPLGTDKRFHYMIKVSGAKVDPGTPGKNGPVAILEWHSDSPLGTNPDAPGDGTVRLNPEGDYGHGG